MVETMRLKPVGIYQEMYRKVRAELPLLRDSHVDTPIQDRSLVVAYMEAATPIFDVLSDTTDLIDPAKTVRGGLSLVSDGEWIWRVDSVHYLANYSVDIPLEFLAHVRAHDYRPAGGVDVSDAKFDAAISAYF